MNKKKFKKLIYEPKLFFSDFYKKNIKKNNSDKTITIPENSSIKSYENNKQKIFLDERKDNTEPLVIGEIEKINYFTENTNNIKMYDKIIKDKHLASVILTPKTDKLLVKTPFWDILLKDRDFIGFKDRYIFCLYYRPTKGFKEYRYISKIFNSSNLFRSNILKNINNIIVIDPIDLTCFALKESSPYINLIIILSQKYTEFDIIENNKINIDCLIKQENLELDTSMFKRVENFDTFSNSKNVLKSIIIDFNKKEFDLLLPAYGRRENIIDNIDDLNENYDGVIYLRKINRTFNTFSEFISNNIENIDSVYIKESKYLKYKDLILNQDMAMLLKYSLNDGVRYEIITL